MDRRSYRIGILGLGIGLGLGCAASGTRTADVPVGHPRFEQLCSQCHTLDRVEQAHQTLSPEEMKAIVERMAQKPKSSIDPNSIEDIVQQIY